MSKILYIFPHPDDESFGPAPAMWQQKRQGHEVYLLTLTKGGATKQRFKLNLSVEEMGEVRYQEMLAVEKVLELDGMTVLNLPDSGLKEMDPRDIELIIKHHIQELKPEIIVTYPVHGISGFHDHLITHAVVKRVYLELLDEGVQYLKRLAFFTLSEEIATGEDGLFKLNFSTEEEIDCAFPITEEDIEKMKAALACYETYKETIEKSNVVEKVGSVSNFEFFQENFSPSIAEITSFPSNL